MTKKAPTAAKTSTTKPAGASRELDMRSAVIADLHKHAVRERELAQLMRAAARQRAADRAAVAHDERRRRALRHVGERSFHTRGVLLERLAAGEAEVDRVECERAVPGVWILGLDVGDQASLPLAAPRLGEALVHDRREAELGADDLRGLARAAEPPRIERFEAEPLRLPRERPRLLPTAVVEGLVDRALHA